MKKNRFWLIVCGVVIVGIILILFLGFISNSNVKDTAFRTVRVTSRDIETTVLATGIIKPKIGAEVEVGSRVSGIVKRLYVNVGDQVMQGDILAEIDPLELQARYDQAMAALDNARAELKYSEQDLKRKQSLRKRDFTSQSNVDLAERANEVALSQVKQARANLEYARIQLEYTHIRAPISGVVASVSTQEGETVTASFVSPTFVNIIDLSRLEVWAYVDETDIGRIQIGQSASFTVDTYTDTDFTGRVNAIYPKAEMKDNVVNYISIIEITDDQGKVLRPEMTATLRIAIDCHENVITIPNRAIRREGRLRYVFTLKKGRPQRQGVTTGVNDKVFTEIVEGLNLNDLVILDDVEAIINP